MDGVKQTVFLGCMLSKGDIYKPAFSFCGSAERFANFALQQDFFTTNEAFFPVDRWGEADSVF